MRTPYKNYLLRQMGIKESQVPPSIVERNAFPGIDPDELEMGTEDEKDEHNMSPERAAQTAKQHLGKPNQRHYYTGMETAKKAGMLRDALAGGGAISPTARSTPVIAVAIRGSNTGGLPSGADQTGISPNTPTGRLGGYEPIPTAKDNSNLVNKTPKNTTIDSTTPIAINGGEVQSDPHPHQVQHSQGEPPQSVTGASTDSSTALTLKSAMPKEKNVDIDVADESSNKPENNDMDGEESMEDNDKAKQGLNEGKHKAGCTCGFCANKGSFGKKKTEDGNDKSDADDKKEKNDDTSFAGLIKGKSKNKAKKGSEKLEENESPEYGDRSGYKSRQCKSCGKSFAPSSRQGLSDYCVKCRQDGKDKPDTKKLNEIKLSLQEKAIAGKMDKRETRVFNLIQEVLKKRGAK